MQPWAPASYQPKRRRDVERTLGRVFYVNEPNEATGKVTPTCVPSTPLAHGGIEAYASTRRKPNFASADDYVKIVSKPRPSAPECVGQPLRAID